MPIAGRRPCFLLQATGAALVLATLLLPAAQACGPFRVAFQHYPGLYEVGSDGRAHGLDVDLLDALAARSQCRLQGTAVSNVRLWQALETGDADIVTAALITPDRERLAEFVPVVQAQLHLLVSLELARRLAGPADFLADASLRLGVVRGARHAPATEPWIEALRQAGRVSESADKPSLLKAFKARRIEAVLVYPMELYEGSPQWPEDLALRAWWPDSLSVGAWALSRKTLAEAERRRLREALLSLLHDGTVQRLADRHLGPVQASRLIVKPLEAPAAGRPGSGAR